MSQRCATAHDICHLPAHCLKFSLSYYVEFQCNLCAEMAPGLMCSVNC